MNHLYITSHIWVCILVIMTGMYSACSQSLAVPPVLMGERSDAGAALTDTRATVIELATVSAKQLKQFPVMQRTFNYVMGGGVRGFGMLAYYDANGLGKVLVRRVTKQNSKEPYTPICLARVFSPEGKLLVAHELTEQKETDRGYILTIPNAGEGIYRVSMSGGRSNDQFFIGLPQTDTWGVRGEMALGITDTTPKAAYIYVPRTVKMILLEQYGHTDKPIQLLDSTNKQLAIAQRNHQSRMMMQLEKVPTNTVLKLDLSNREGAAFALDGVPGLICPTPQAARKLAGGAVESNGFLLAGPLQARIRKWMANIKPEDLEVKAKFPTQVPADLKDPMRECLMFGKYAAMSTFGNGLEYQITDPDNSYYGTLSKVGTLDLRDFSKKVTDWQSFLHDSIRGFSAPAALASVASVKTELNCYYNDPAVIKRAVLSAFYYFVSMQGDDLVREGDIRRNNYPITHIFFAYDTAVTQPLMLLKDKLDKETYELWKEAAIAVGDKIADYQAYQSNQWAHMIVSHLNNYLATDEKRFLGYFERQARAYLTGAFGTDAKFGQHPAGYYLEQYGPDGNYDHLNQYAIVSSYLMYRDLKEADPKLVKMFHDGIQRNLEFKRFYWLAQPNGHFFNPNAFNCRTNSLLCSPSYPGEYLAKKIFPLAQTHWLALPTPTTGTAMGKGSTFPHVINNEKWARHLIKMLLPRGNKNFGTKGFSGAWTPHIMHAYFDVPENAQPVTLPTDGPDNTWNLPGHIAYKRGKLYGTVFYNVDGRNPNRNLMGKFGGGPTVIWNKDLGTFVSSMINTKKNKIIDINDLTQSCVFGYFQKNKLFYTGAETPTFKWIEQDKIFEIHSKISKPRGNLIWRYELNKDSITIKVALKANSVKQAWINLPIYFEQAGLNVQVASQYKVSINNGKAQANIEIQNGGPVELTQPLKTTHNAVKCLRIPMNHDGSFTSMTITSSSF